MIFWQVCACNSFCILARFVIMRRMFSLTGTVFMLRCVTMLITSLSVPGRHLQCEPKVTFLTFS